jgi:hypothetical protein
MQKLARKIDENGACAPEEFTALRGDDKTLGLKLVHDVVEAVRQAQLGTSHSAEMRQRMSETQRRRGTLVRGTIPFTAEEDELVRTLATAEASRRIARSRGSICARRKRLPVLDGRKS